MRVLVVDDDDLIRVTLMNSLRSWGYEPVAANDGAEALSILRQENPPRLILLDWMMPAMSGIELCTEIRKTTERPYTYIIFLSAKANKQDTIKALQAGADDYLIKPFDQQELKARVLAGQRVLDLQGQLLATQKELEFQAFHDSLTGLWNRRALMEFLERELAHARRKKTSLGIILGDIDRFKEVNDAYGHLTGDLILQEAARRLKSHLRQYDGIGRIGGEEFLAVMVEIDGASALSLAERMRCSICSSPVQTPDGNISIALSLGVVVASGDHVTETNQLLRAADEALYRAKNSGRNRVEMAPAPVAGLPHPC